jgi:hypothetical protein
MIVKVAITTKTKFSYNPILIHCVQEVCVTAGSYVGFDRGLGLCLCSADDLEEICDLECRKKSQYQMTFVCAGTPLEPYIHLRDENNQTIVSSCLLFIFYFISFYFFFTYVVRICIKVRQP